MTLDSTKDSSTLINGTITGSIDTNGRESPLQSCIHIKSNDDNSLSNICKTINEKLNGFLQFQTDDARIRATQEHTRISLDVMRKALNDYGFDQLAMSFNGGKDCLVMLILYLSALHEYFTSSTSPQPSTSKTISEPTSTTTTTTTSSSTASHQSYSSPSSSPSPPRSIPAAYVHCQHPFAEVDDFVNECVQLYHLDLLRYEGHKGLKRAFTSFLSHRPNIRAIFVGTRRTDPHGEQLKHFDPTDGGWPSFMRVHPVIDWSYVDIWTFLRAIAIPYCVLYDQGYTSLGGTTDTLPNPALIKVDAKDGKLFRPAYELVADHEERLGREKH